MIIEDLKQQLAEAQEKLAADQVEASQVKERPVLAGNIAASQTIRSVNIGSALDVFNKPGCYFGKPGSLLIPEVETSGEIVKYGESLDIPDRISKSHVPDK